MDLRVLRVMRDHPDARSRDSIRGYVGVAAHVVQTSIARILEAGWALRRSGNVSRID